MYLETSVYNQDATDTTLVYLNLFSVIDYTVSSCTFCFQHEEISQQDNVLRAKFIQRPNSSTVD